MSDAVVLAGLFFLTATLYTSVGHAGASGYLAAMALFGMADDKFRTVALVLNIVAATPTSIRFISAGHFDRKLFLPLAIGSVPLAFTGSLFTIPGEIVEPIIGTALLIAAVRFLWSPTVNRDAVRPMPIAVGVLLGVVIGFASGLTGVGGGVYLTPILLLMKWADTKTAAGVSATFILANSAAAIVGRILKAQSFPSELPYWALAVLAGSLIGATLGSRVLGGQVLRRILAVVLLIAAAKLLFGSVELLWK